MSTKEDKLADDVKYIVENIDKYKEHFSTEALERIDKALSQTIDSFSYIEILKDIMKEPDVEKRKQLAKEQLDILEKKGA